MTADALDRGRTSFLGRAWGDAYARLAAADREGPLQCDDLERLAIAAQLLGQDDASAEAWVRAFHEHVRRADPGRAVWCAFWLGFGLLLKGEAARAGGWFARARRLLDDAQLDCAERGYLLVPLTLERIGAGDIAGAYAASDEAAQIGARFADADLMALGGLGRGQALILGGDVHQGMVLLDEVMVAVTAGEVSPLATGIVYCAVLEACQQTFHLRRAQEWTAALSNWCEAQPELVLFRGQCLVHRAEILQLRGAWPDAMHEARRAYELLSHRPYWQVGPAFYQRAEVHRLRGELSEAEEAYREASQRGHSPEPGLALLLLARGEVDAAVATMRRALAETEALVLRPRLLAAYVEIMLAADDLQSARLAANELAGIAADLDVAWLHAMSDQMAGAVLLREGDTRAALGVLRRAWTCWQQLDVPYEAARTRVWIGVACGTLGDQSACALELEAARHVFQQLGATTDLARVNALLSKPEAPAAGGLTARELEVLRLVAAGKTNRVIADDLVISERTVARHVSNIFAKLGLSSRAAATAHAYEHRLV